MKKFFFVVQNPSETAKNGLHVTGYRYDTFEAAETQARYWAESAASVKSVILEGIAYVYPEAPPVTIVKL